MFGNIFKKNRKSDFLEIEPHEIFLDELAQKKEREYGISEKKFEVPLSQTKLKIFYIGFVILVAFLFYKTLNFGIVKGDYYSQLAQDNCHNVGFFNPVRGVVYDSKMNQMVFNRTSYDLVLDRKNLPQYQTKKTIVAGVAEILKEKPQDLLKKIEEGEFDFVLIKENLDHDNLVLLKTKIKDFKGFEIKENTVREYKDASLFSHLLGFTGKISPEELKDLKEYSITDYIGKQGLEKFYEETLRGVPGRVLVERDAVGNKVSENLITEAQTGDSLVLWLDSELQKKAEEALKASLDRVGSKRGVVIAMDPNNGGILSLVSLPSFDNNLFSQGISAQDLKKLNDNPNYPLFNRAIAGGYPVGSSIKPLTASAALQEKIISPDKEVECKGGISIPNPFDPEHPSVFLDWETHGWTDLRKAIAQSCNVYFYTIGGGYQSQPGLGVERIKKYLQLFGWGNKTGVDIAGEIPGLLPDPAWKENYFQDDSQKKIWRIGDTYHLSIGQGDISVTPLQVVMAFSAIANGGKLYQPLTVKEIIKGSADSSKIVKTMEPKIIRENFIEPENLKIVREGMREGVIYGSSVLLNDLPVKAASKTGTAQTSRDEVYHNWVTVFAPYDNPRIVLTVLIEDVEGMQYAALPVAKDILNWYFTR
ncbi:MAG: penicillin-binding protein 2 [Candidatus Nealsonbacteria bacterium]|nr:penicillin-binding protein 2 [Candidatus Nealsonbacteria bacterium]